MVKKNPKNNPDTTSEFLTSNTQLDPPCVELSYKLLVVEKVAYHMRIYIFYSCWDVSEEKQSLDVWIPEYIRHDTHSC